MILVLAGTGDGRLLVRELIRQGHQVLASALTEYGGRLLAQEDGCEVRTGALSADALANLISEYGIRAVVDATHPYAENITALAAEACRRDGIPYLRYRRAETLLHEHPLVHVADTWEEAADQAFSLAQTVMLTTGSRHLEPFVNAMRAQAAAGNVARLIARVLPDVESIARCRETGFVPADIVALQGPVSTELNAAMFRHYGVKAVVAKNSGTAGGTDAKLAACLLVGVPLVVVRRSHKETAGTGLDITEIIEICGRCDDAYRHRGAGARQSKKRSPSRLLRHD